jgi:segregation and condensation protein B
MQVLLDRSLVKIAGRAEVPGRPLLYSTTEYFLQHFGLKTTDELPNASELKRIVLPTAPVPAEEKAAEPKAEELPLSADPVPETTEPAEPVAEAETESAPEPELAQGGEAEAAAAPASEQPAEST